VKKRYEVTLSYTIDVEILDSQEDETLKDFRSSMSSTADIFDVMKHIAWSTCMHGDFCEGVGDNGKEFFAEILDNDSEIEEI